MNTFPQNAFADCGKKKCENTLKQIAATIKLLTVRLLSQVNPANIQNYYLSNLWKREWHYLFWCQKVFVLISNPPYKKWSYAMLGCPIPSPLSLQLLGKQWSAECKPKNNYVWKQPSNVRKNSSKAWCAELAKSWLKSSLHFYFFFFVFFQINLKSNMTRKHELHLRIWSNIFFRQIW